MTERQAGTWRVPEHFNRHISLSLRILWGFWRHLNNHQRFRNTNWSTGNHAGFYTVYTAALFVINVSLLSFWKTALVIVNIALHCCELAQVHKIFKSKRRETKSAGDIKVLANIHWSGLFTWDGSKALREVWPGSNSAQLEQTTPLAASTRRGETNHWIQTKLDLCWWWTRSSVWSLV